MSPILRRTLLFAVCLSAALSANAEIIRDRSLLLSIQVQGVALNMTPELVTVCKSACRRHKKEKSCNDSA